MHLKSSDTGGPDDGARWTGAVIVECTRGVARRGAAQERWRRRTQRGTVKEGPQPDCVFCPV